MQVKQYMNTWVAFPPFGFVIRFEMTPLLSICKDIAYYCAARDQLRILGKAHI